MINPTVNTIFSWELIETSAYPNFFTNSMINYFAVPVRARPVLDDRMRNLGLNKDVRLFDSENVSARCIV